MGHGGICKALMMSALHTSMGCSTYDQKGAKALILCVPRRPERLTPSMRPAQVPDQTGRPRGELRIKRRSVLIGSQIGKTISAFLPVRPVATRSMIRDAGKKTVRRRLANEACASATRTAAEAVEERMATPTRR